MEKVSFATGLKPRIGEGHLTPVVQRRLEGDALQKKKSKHFERGLLERTEKPQSRSPDGTPKLTGLKIPLDPSAKSRCLRQSAAVETDSGLIH